MSEPIIYANLLHLSYNMWGDWDRPGAGKYWAAKPYLRFDESLWNELLAALALPIQEWNSYSPKAGWSLKLKLGKRTIVYLAPARAAFG